MVREALAALLIVAGTVTLTVGAWTVSSTVGYLTLGVLLFGLGLALAIGDLGETSGQELTEEVIVGGQAREPGVVVMTPGPSPLTDMVGMAADLPADELDQLARRRGERDRTPAATPRPTPTPRPPHPSAPVETTVPMTNYMGIREQEAASE
jgi:hypothetical protein